MTAWCSDPAILEQVKTAQPVFWSNPHATRDAPAGVFDAAVDDADARMARSRTLIGELFPGQADLENPICSPLLDVSAFASSLGADGGDVGRWWVKADHQLPVAGSIKARGGFHEVIAYAERVALARGLIASGDDLVTLASDRCRALFEERTIVVGSTGNLGMSIGLMSAALGFQAIVHMSSDAKAWKKQRLRDHGACVVEHAGDYAQAVENGRAAAEQDPLAHFVDDERSVDLFVGYAAAARELAEQLRRQSVVVDADHPLFVYIPCGVGGAPGGLTYGLKRLFGPNVHCLFAEPVQSPCMLVQLIADRLEPVSVYDLGLTNKTEADGLAVGQASMLVAPLMRERLDAVYTLTDAQLLALFREGQECLGLSVEPSAAAALAGPALVTRSPAGRAYLEAHGLADKLKRSNHVLWTTGGSLVPEEERLSLMGRAAFVDPFPGGLFDQA